MTRKSEPESVATIAERIRKNIEARARDRKEPAPDPSSCAICGDVGFVKGSRNRYVECECAVERRVLARLPERYRDASLVDISIDIRECVVDWFKTPGDGMFITGAAGRGKTYLAAAIARSLLLIRKEAVFVRCADFYYQLREAYRQNIDERSVYSDYLRAPFLILDDLGAGGLSDFQRYTISDVIDQRINKKFPTIITSNWTIDEIAVRMDDRLGSRLSPFTQIALVGRDRRIPT